ncbi:ABC transporter substrate-binding protein [Phormidium tenue FACHB-886]|nr:ABC transporter substrate-binding protein [Phormidium tenue FACHB-886]
MPFHRRTVLFGLFGLSLPLISSSCAQNSSEANVSGSSASSSSTGTEQIPAKIRVGYQVYAGSEILAKGLGLAKQTFANTEVEYLRFDSGRDVNTAFAANSIDIGVLGSAAAAVGLSRSIPYDVFYVYELTDKAEALVVRDNVKTIGDIRGKKIATTFSSTSHYSLLSLLELEKINQSEVTILDMLPQDILAAWQRGNIDGAYIWEPVLAAIEQGGGKILVTSGDLAKRGHATLNVAVVAQNFARQYPNVVKQYIGMLDKAVKVYRQDATAAGKALSVELGVPPEEALRQASSLTWFDASEQVDAKNLGTADKPGDISKTLKQTADFMVSQKAIPSAPDQDTLLKHIYYP